MRQGFLGTFCDSIWRSEWFKQLALQPAVLQVAETWRHSAAEDNETAVETLHWVSKRHGPVDSGRRRRGGIMAVTYWDGTCARFRFPVIHHSATLSSYPTIHSESQNSAEMILHGSEVLQRLQDCRYCICPKRRLSRQEYDGSGWDFWPLKGYLMRKPVARFLNVPKEETEVSGRTPNRQITLRKTRAISRPWHTPPAPVGPKSLCGVRTIYRHCSVSMIVRFCEKYEKKTKTRIKIAVSEPHRSTPWIPKLHGLARLGARRESTTGEHSAYVQLKTETPQLGEVGAERDRHRCPKEFVFSSGWHFVSSRGGHSVRVTS
ncbi:uncharacterized protein CLUP02_11436 [Colletotrichum lupini]|uniref:Uncharacterized protein n=1 Tax=Colletotrichum lupini TaxID=145971 RepID=A0A9Q8T0E7_9PEZI|nr:uncharacterized protein CLUP02_11436 [Colletotrichum lupini]UQC85937.1 hypothetical protein CLUP02_11436 [Colletotrichum lupini]